MKTATIGLDVAKNVLQIHGVDERGQVVVSKQLKRGKVMEYFANLEPCLVGMEACGGAHDWARRLIGCGHQAKLRSPQFVKPYVKGNKNDTQAKALEQEIKAWHQKDAASMQLATIPGIVPLTASAITATVGDARDFKSGRQLAASLGLVPRQH